jgi:transcriptional regulator with XRE-family HTH domain
MELRKEGADIVETSKISSFLRQMRLQNNMTQLNVAERLNVTPQAVSKWERCEAMPDITLLPDLAEMYGITVGEILAAGTASQGDNLLEIMQVLNSFVDERIFEKVRREFEKAMHFQQLSVPMDFFMALGNRQKDILLELLLRMKGYAMAIDELIPYLNMAQRARLIRRVAEDNDQEAFESLIPFMTGSLRAEILHLLLERRQFAFLDEFAMFLTHEQKNFMIGYFMEHQLDAEVLERLLPFFSKEQRKKITEWEESL